MENKQIDINCIHMVSIKLKFRKSRKSRNGRCFVQLIYKRKVKTIATGIELKVTEWNSSKGCVNFRSATLQRNKELIQMQETLQGIVADLQKIVEDYQGRGQEFTVSMIVQAYKQYNISMSFFSIMETRILELKKNNQFRTALNYQYTMRIFLSFCGDASLPVSSITNVLIKNFETYLREKGDSMNTISFYMRILRATYNYAVAQEWIKNPQQLFKNVYTGVERTVKRAVEVNIIHSLIRLDLTKNPKLELARDLFMFSIYMRGMAFVDLAHLRKNNIRDGTLIYRRRKTNQLFHILLPNCSKEIIDKYIPMTQSSPFLFPILQTESQQEYSNALRSYNRHLKHLSGMIGSRSKLTSYVARHTWATLAKQLGIKIQVISEALGHTSEETTRIYLDSINNQTINQANNKVIAVLLKGKK